MTLSANRKDRHPLDTSEPEFVEMRRRPTAVRSGTPNIDAFLTIAPECVNEASCLRKATAKPILKQSLLLIRLATLNVVVLSGCDVLLKFRSGQLVRKCV